MRIVDDRRTLRSSGVRFGLRQCCTSLALVPVLLLTGCSIRSLAINALADSLVASGDVFASDEDPELVAEAVPFALKTIEALLAEKPNQRELLLAACQNFTQYSYAFVQIEAERLEEIDYEASEALYDRALKLYLRARDYCFRSLTLEWPGVVDRLRTEPDLAVEVFESKDVPLVFWTAAAWGGAIAIGQDRPDLVADVPAVTALMSRALVLDEGFNHGAIHGVMISLNSLPEALGGSPEKARYHFDRAVELSNGLSAGPYVSLAESVVVAEQNWREFERLLQVALEIDPDRAPSIRLVNIIEQRRARWLLERIELLFIDYPIAE